MKTICKGCDKVIKEDDLSPEGLVSHGFCIDCMFALYGEDFREMMEGDSLHHLPE